jgi:hypothetical protein
MQNTEEEIRNASRPTQALEDGGLTNQKKMQQIVKGSEESAVAVAVVKSEQLETQVETQVETGKKTSKRAEDKVAVFAGPNPPQTPKVAVYSGKASTQTPSVAVFAGKDTPTSSRIVVVESSHSLATSKSAVVKSSDSPATAVLRGKDSSATSKTVVKSNDSLATSKTAARRGKDAQTTPPVVKDAPMRSGRQRKLTPKMASFLTAKKERESAAFNEDRKKNKGIYAGLGSDSYDDEEEEMDVEEEEEDQEEGGSVIRVTSDHAVNSGSKIENVSSRCQTGTYALAHSRGKGKRGKATGKGQTGRKILPKHRVAVDAKLSSSENTENCASVSSASGKQTPVTKRTPARNAKSENIDEREGLITPGNERSEVSESPRRSARLEREMPRGSGDEELSDSGDTHPEGSDTHLQGGDTHLEGGEFPMSPRRSGRGRLVKEEELSGSENSLDVCNSPRPTTRRMGSASGRPSPGKTLPQSSPTKTLPHSSPTKTTPHHSSSKTLPRSSPGKALPQPSPIASPKGRKKSVDESETAMIDVDGEEEVKEEEEKQAEKMRSIGVGVGKAGKKKKKQKGRSETMIDDDGDDRVELEEDDEEERGPVQMRSIGVGVGEPGKKKKKKKKQKRRSVETETAMIDVDGDEKVEEAEEERGAEKMKSVGVGVGEPRKKKKQKNGNMAGHSGLKDKIVVLLDNEATETTAQGGRKRKVSVVEFFFLNIKL